MYRGQLARRGKKTRHQAIKGAEFGNSGKDRSACLRRQEKLQESKAVKINKFPVFAKNSHAKTH